jgi:hypothetical protein
LNFLQVLCFLAQTTTMVQRPNTTRPAYAPAAPRVARAIPDTPTPAPPAPSPATLRIKWWEYGMRGDVPMDCPRVWEEIKHNPDYPHDVDFSDVIYTYEQLSIEIPISVLISHMYDPKYLFTQGDCQIFIDERIRALPRDQRPNIHYS